MKKIYLFVLLLLVMPFSVNAANKIYSIDIDVNLNRDGSANITEVWDVDGSDGTEWYKVMNNLGNMKLSDFTVMMDNKMLTKKSWNVNESLSAKAGYYGINYTSNGLELCFGKYDYMRHTFTLNYTLSNFIFNTDNEQVLYYNFIDRLSNVDFNNFSLDITSYYEFPDTLDVWGYGYKGYAYVKDGKISMSNESDMDDKYVVLLAKFPSGTFDTLNSYSQFDTFDMVYNMAESGSFDYDYNETSLVEKIIGVISGFINIFLPFLIFFIIIKLGIESGYGYINNKKIDKKNINMFRDIPCNKDIYYANTLIKLNNFGYKESNILGAIILKWVKEDKVSFRNEKVGIFNKETSVIDLTKEVSFDNEIEEKLFKMMKKASGDGMLETREFEKWASKNYTEFLGLFKRIENNKINELKSNNHIYKRENRKDCKKKNIMDDMIYEDSVKLYGLKKYLEEFSNMDTKEVMEVKLWDEYLMFAYLFGIADKVARQMKNMYPEIVTAMEQSNFDYNTVVFINRISVNTVSAASSARSAAQSYSSGGGGFSSGGGGGGSFGGGGGGSR